MIPMSIMIHLESKTGIYMTHKVLDLESDLPLLQVDAHQVISFLLILLILYQPLEFLGPNVSSNRSLTASYRTYSVYWLANPLKNVF